MAPPTAASFHGAATSMMKNAQTNPALRASMVKDRTIPAATLALQCILHTLCLRWEVDAPESVSIAGGEAHALAEQTELPLLESCADWSDAEALDGGVALSRLLRNLCVEGEVAQRALREKGSLDVLIGAARATVKAAGGTRWDPETGGVFLIAVLQALGNAVVNCRENQDDLWGKAWPDPLLECAMQVKKLNI